MMQAEEMGFNPKEDLKESEADEPAENLSKTEISQSGEMMSKECNVHEVYQWAKNELIELESISDTIKNFDKMETKLK